MNEYQPNVSVESYKQAHENFMKGLQGTTMFETTTLLMILPVCNFLKEKKKSNESFFKK